MTKNFEDLAPALIDGLKKGAFLTVSNDNEDNTMTIGWATIGRIWNKPVLMVAVRYSRYTYNLLNNSKEFTVSIPKKGTMSEELKFCGTKSGRDFDKFKECNIKTKKAKTVDTVVLTDCKHHFECRVIYQQTMEPETLENESKERFYKDNNDYHVLFYGEILDSYEN